MCIYIAHPGALGEHDSLELGQMVTENVGRLKDKHEKVQREGVKVLTALARTCKHAFCPAV